MEVGAGEEKEMAGSGGCGVGGWGGSRVCCPGICFTPLDLLIVGISFGRSHAAGLTAVK